MALRQIALCISSYDLIFPDVSPKHCPGLTLQDDDEVLSEYGDDDGLQWHRTYDPHRSVNDLSFPKPKFQFNTSIMQVLLQGSSPWPGELP